MPPTRLSSISESTPVFPSLDWQPAITSSGSPSRSSMTGPDSTSTRPGPASASPNRFSGGWRRRVVERRSAPGSGPAPPCGYGHPAGRIPTGSIVGDTSPVRIGIVDHPAPADRLNTPTIWGRRWPPGAGHSGVMRSIPRHDWDTAQEQVSVRIATLELFLRLEDLPEGVCCIRDCRVGAPPPTSLFGPVTAERASWEWAGQMMGGMAGSSRCRALSSRRRPLAASQSPSGGQPLPGSAGPGIGVRTSGVDDRIPLGRILCLRATGHRLRPTSAPWPLSSSRADHTGGGGRATLRSLGRPCRARRHEGEHADPNDLNRRPRLSPPIIDAGVGWVATDYDVAAGFAVERGIVIV